MKQQNMMYFLITSLGIGAAMSAALHNTAVGMAVGFGVGIAITYSGRTSCHLKKSNHKTENE